MKTKTFLFAAALIALIPASAFATGNNNGNGCRNRCGDTSAPVHSTNMQGQAQGQIQGQAQSTRVHTRVNTRVNSTGVGIGQGGAGGAGGNASAVSNARGGSARAYNAGNHQSMSYQEARPYREAPSVYGSFSSGPTSPCERNPFGVGGSSAVPNPFSALFQIPVASGECWGERASDRLMAAGCTNAALAVLAGDSVRVALANNPCGGRRAGAIRAKY